MVLHVTIPDEQERHDGALAALTPRIGVIGVGGAGGNAVNNMMAAGLDGIGFAAANTDAQALAASRSPRVIRLGQDLTAGLGAGSNPDVGRRAAEEALDELKGWLDGLHMVFIAAGMGGGTGTGAAPVIARLACERNLLTVAVVTKPFHFEGQPRMCVAEEGVARLESLVNTLIVTSNQNLFRVAERRTSMSEAFLMADEVLHNGVRGVIDLVVKPGLINLDFADIRAVMAEMGRAQMGSFEAEGDERALRAAEGALGNPLLENGSITGAASVLVNVTGGRDVTLMEVEEAVSRIRRETGEDADVVFGVAVDNAMEGRLRVSILAAGIPDGEGVRAAAVGKRKDDRQVSLAFAAEGVEGEGEEKRQGQEQRQGQGQREGQRDGQGQEQGREGGLRRPAKDEYEDEEENPNAGLWRRLWAGLCGKRRKRRHAPASANGNGVALPEEGIPLHSSQTPPPVEEKAPPQRGDCRLAEGLAASADDGKPAEGSGVELLRLEKEKAGGKESQVAELLARPAYLRHTAN